MCGTRGPFVPVPYVVSHPRWLVEERLPLEPRTTWLHFRGHLPKAYFDTAQVRRKLVEALQNEPNVSVLPANVKRGASYTRHDNYLMGMLRSKFCLAPRGDTASSKRLCERPGHTQYTLPTHTVQLSWARVRVDRLEMDLSPSLRC